MSTTAVWQTLPPALKLALVGHDHEVTGAVTEEELSSLNLHVGYAQEEESYEKFLTTLATYYGEKKSDFTVVLPGYTNDRKKLQELVPNSEVIQQHITLDQLKMDPLEAHKENPSQQKSQASSHKPIIHMITTDRVSQAVFLSLLKISQPFTLITGDQSLFEALALEKFPLYECRDHKHLLTNALLGDNIEHLRASPPTTQLSVDALLQKISNFSQSSKMTQDYFQWIRSQDITDRLIQLLEKKFQSIYEHSEILKEKQANIIPGYTYIANLKTVHALKLTQDGLTPVYPDQKLEVIMRYMSDSTSVFLLKCSKK